MKEIYKHVDDIDLFVGGILETNIAEAVVGPTFQCLIGDQFFRLKWGDRFFYDLGGRPSSFTPGNFNFYNFTLQHENIILLKIH